MLWRPGGAVASEGVSRYRFALQPKWILGHVIVIVLVIGFLNAGAWQIRRLHERQAYNAHVVANLNAPVAHVESVLPRGADFATVTHELDRRVIAKGRYLLDDEIVINAQANPESVPGVWIVTPLLLDDGRVLLVNRGWLPSTGPLTSPPEGSSAPGGRVTVQGLISETQVKSEGESPETGHARQTSFLRIDIARIQEQFSQRLLPAFLLRQAQRPVDAGSRPPQNLQPAAITSGPHLGYVIQWFGFTLVAVIGYPMLLWLIARDRGRGSRRGRGEHGGTGPDDLPPGAFVDDDGIIDMTAVTHWDKVDRDEVGSSSGP